MLTSGISSVAFIVQPDRQRQVSLFFVCWPFVLFVYVIYIAYICIEQIHFNMRKLIDIPNEKLKNLKILAAKNDKDLKNYIQDLILNHYKFAKTTELAVDSLDDGQSIRPFWNYLHETFEAIKGKLFTFENITFNDEVEFLEHIQAVCDWMIQVINDEKKEIEDYENK